MAVSDGPAAAVAFDDTMAAQQGISQAAMSKGPLSVTIRSQATYVRKPADPYRLFEATMLKSFFDMMLPHGAKNVYGSGFAGEVWKSMLAEALGTEVSKGKGVGIARKIEEKARRTKS